MRLHFPFNEGTQTCIKNQSTSDKLKTQHVCYSDCDVTQLGGKTNKCLEAFCLGTRFISPQISSAVTEGFRDVSLHATNALGGRGRIAPTHS
jgi:hypothetical protein